MTTPDPSGKSWTSIDAIADAIDRSHACNGGMVTLSTTDGEDFEVWRQELAGICDEQKRINSNVFEYKSEGDLMFADDSSPAWAIQLTLIG